MTTSDTSLTPPRPLGFWLRTVDALLDRAFADALEKDDASRRDWMLLNAVDGTVDAPWLIERLARRSGRARRLAERGWIAETDGGWTLTDDGRAAKDRLGGIVDGIRERVAGAVSPEDLATTLASLEAIARELGWDENRPFDAARDAHRRFGRHGHRFGSGFDAPGFPGAPGFAGAAGFGPERRFGPRHGFGPGFDPRRGFGPGFDPRRGVAGEDCAERGPRGGHRHGGEAAFERGFSAGFAQGRAAASAAPESASPAA